MLQTKHETHGKILWKFAVIIIVFLGYFGLVSYRYGFQDGFFITWLTWSFFVLCTPVADAGFLISFPLRVLFKIRMWVSQIFVSLAAVIINIYAFFEHHEWYEKTELLRLFKHILEKPLPFWSVIILSMLGTFLSVKFGDELIDVFKHEDRLYHQKHHLKWKIIAMVFVFVTILVLYHFLLTKWNIKID